jgi:Tfp pilus assembly protein PilP
MLARGGQVDEKRDPFRPLPDRSSPSLRKTATASPQRRPKGLRGRLISETSLVGIISSSETSWALLKATNHPLYIVKAGSQLYDGRVVLISDMSVVFLKYREDPPNSFVVVKTFTEEKGE